MRFLAFSLRRDQLSKRAGRLIKHRNFVEAKQLVKFLRRTRYVLGHYNQTAAIKQRSPDFPYGKIESVGMEKRPDIVLVKPEPLISRAEQPRHIRMFNHHAFGRSCGTGSVDHISQMLRFDLGL